MKISILDDYHDTFRTLECFKKLAGHERDLERPPPGSRCARRTIAGRRGAGAIRERTQIRRPLLQGLNKLRLISQRSVYPRIDVDACSELGIIVSTSQHAGAPSCAAAELTWALVLAAPICHFPGFSAAICWGSWRIVRERQAI